MQQLVTGLAVRVFISIKRPFKIRDRIFLPNLNIIGDVMVGVFHIVLNQVGGIVGSEEASGRTVLISNIFAFINNNNNKLYTVRGETIYT